MRTKLEWKYDEVTVDPFQEVITGGSSTNNDDPKGSPDDTKNPPPNNDLGDDPNSLKDGQEKWLAGVSPDLRDSLKDFKSPNDLAKQYLETQEHAKKYEKAIFIPEDGAKDEDVRSYLTNIGVPEKSEDYPDFDIDIPKGFNIDIKGLKQEAFESGLRADVFNSFMGNRIKAALKQMEGLAEKSTELNKKALEQAKEKYGEDYSSVKEKADLLMTIGGEPMQALLREKDLALDGRFISFVMEIATKLTEDSIPSGDNKGKPDRKRGEMTFPNTK